MRLNLLFERAKATCMCLDTCDHRSEGTSRGRRDPASMAAPLASERASMCAGLIRATDASRGSTREKAGILLRQCPNPIGDWHTDAGGQPDVNRQRPRTATVQWRLASHVDSDAEWRGCNKVRERRTRELLDVNGLKIRIDASLRGDGVDKSGCRRYSLLHSRCG